MLAIYRLNKEVVFDMRPNADVSPSIQARLEINKAPASRREIRAGTVNVGPSRRGFFATFSNVARWEATAEGERAFVTTHYRPALDAHAMRAIPIPPFIYELQPGEFKPIGEETTGKMRTDCVVANIPDDTPMDRPPSVPTANPRELTSSRR